MLIIFIWREQLFLSRLANILFLIIIILVNYCNTFSNEKWSNGYS